MMTSLFLVMAVYCGLVFISFGQAYGRTSADCPLGCLCSATSGHVSCENAGLTEVPRVGIGPTVTSLDLAGNQLMVLGPGSLSALRNVVRLKLGNNEIDRILDGSFASNSALQTLDLSSNNLTVVREHTFEGAQMLTNLDLSHNKLTSVDGAFAGLKELSRLDLRSNRLTEISQFAFRDQVNLRYLLLSDNTIAHIDRRAFRNLEKLTYLVLRQNPISSVERFQFHSLFLSYIDLSECGLSSVPRGLPGSIRYLQLRRNNISVVHRTSFRDCAYVSILVLDENSISEIESGAFEGMHYLQQLWLNHNNLRRFTVRLPNSVQRLLVESNALLEFSRDVFPPDSQLSALSLAGNNLAELPAASLARLVRLRSLDVSVNNIRRIYAGTFSNNTRLNSLQLSRNPLEYFYAGSLHGLSSLHQLGMAFVPSVNTFIADDVFRDLNELTILDMDSSPALVRSVLASDSLMSSLPALHELGILNSHLSRLRADFPTWFPHLVVVRLSSARWHCDAESAAWLRGWISSTGVEVIGAGEIRCLTPTELRGRSVLTLAEWELQQHGDNRPHSTNPNEVTTTSTASRVRTVISSSKNFSEFYWRQRLRPASGGQFDHRHRWSASSSDDNLTSFPSKSAAAMLPLDNDDVNDDVIEQNEFDFVDRSDSVFNVGNQRRGSRWNDEGVNSSLRDPSTTLKSPPVTSSRTSATTSALSPLSKNTPRVAPVERRRQLDYRPTTAAMLEHHPDASSLSPSSMPSSGTGSGRTSLMAYVAVTVTLLVTLVVVVAVAVVILRTATTSKSRRQATSSRDQHHRQLNGDYSIDKLPGNLVQERFARGPPLSGEHGTIDGSPVQDAMKPRKHLQFNFPPPTSTIDRQPCARKNYRPVDDVTVVMTSLVSSTSNGEGSAEALSLIPGRDINHEGPHLVYQWTDF